MRPWIILWKDAYSPVDDWYDMNNYEPTIDELPNVSIGYPFSWAGGYVTLASTIDQDSEQVCTTMAIPMEMVQFAAPLAIDTAVTFGDKRHLNRFVTGDFYLRDELAWPGNPAPLTHQKPHEPTGDYQPSSG